MAVDLAKYCGHGKVAGTKRALRAVGVAVLSTTNEWEVLRFRSKYGVGIVHRNKKGKLTATGAVEATLGHIEAGLSGQIPPKQKKAKPRPGQSAATPTPAVTIFADASHCPKTGVGGWGAWMVSKPRGSHTAGGPMKTRFASSHDAEAAALANALVEAKVRGYLFQGAVVMLQSDCMGALGQVRRRIAGTTDSPIGAPGEYSAGSPVPIPRRGPRGMAPAIEVIWKVATELELQLVVRHVKGHQSAAAVASSGRAWVNRECDRLAGLGMAAARAALNPNSAPSSAPTQELEGAFG